MTRRFWLAAVVITAVLVSGTAQAQEAGERSRLQLLVVNDDGYRAPGLVALIDSLLPLADVFVVAPYEQQSGTGHGITYREPITVRRHENPQGVTWYAVGARPATVTRVALTTLMDHPPDLVVSGINAGDNVGTSAWVSGTVAAAREGALHGIPAVAFSTNLGGAADYAVAAGWARRVVELLIGEDLIHGPLLLNVNIPAGDPKGIRAGPMSLTLGDQRYERRRSPRGLDYLWDDWSPPQDDVQEGTDQWWFSRGYVTVTPLRVDQTDAAQLPVLERVFPDR